MGNKITIIGSGFSAAITKLSLANHNVDIISVKDTAFLRAHLHRERKLECNKLAKQKAFSFVSLRYELGKLRLHDRLSVGGNSNVWGGMVNTTKLKKSAKTFLNQNGIFLRNLNEGYSGYRSNKEGIMQLNDRDEKILDCNKFFTNEKNRFLHSFEIKNKKIFLYVIDANKKNIQTITTDILILAVSFPQLIEIFIRSGFLDSPTLIRLDEFKSKFQLSWQKIKVSSKMQDSVIVQFSFIKAIDHFFGTNLFKYLKSIKLPFNINQVFYYKKETLEFELNPETQTLKNLTKKKAGGSAHYCNLKINGSNINSFIKNLSENIYGVSMPFVTQKTPGPISNDIIEAIQNLDI